MTALADSEALRRAIAMFVAATPPPDAPIEAWREGFERMCATFPVSADAVVETIDLDGIPGLRVAAPGTDGTRAILHYHSGGYVMGSAAGYRNFAVRLSVACGVPVIVPDYRLAPEHPYPAAVEDALIAYRWCCDRYGADRLVVSGDSAGGGLAMATLMALRDRGETLPIAGVAVSPLLDLAGEGESTVSLHGIDPLIDRTMIVEMGKLYIGAIDPHAHPLASPVWGDHHDLPPLYLATSGAEVLCDDAVRFAEGVRRAGGQAELSVVDGMVHIWTIFPFLPEAEATIAEIGAFVRRAFARTAERQAVAPPSTV